MKKNIQNPLALSGLIIIVSVLFFAIFAPWLSPYDPNFIDIHSILLPPSLTHLMGTDGLGRDVFSRNNNDHTHAQKLQQRLKL